MNWFSVRLPVLRQGLWWRLPYHRLVKTRFQLGQFLGDDLLHPGILKANGVDHAAGALRNPGRGVTEPGIFGGSLEGEGAQLVDVVQLGVFIAIAEGAGGGDLI